MANRPSAPSGDYTLKSISYASNATVSPMTEYEMQEGRNNVGEPETPLGSVTNAHKDNYLFRYITEHIIYLTKMVEYLEEKIEGGT